MNARRLLLSAALSCCAAVCSAQVASKPVAASRPIDPAARSNALMKTGGLIHSPATGPAILFLDTQKRVPVAALRDAYDLLQKDLRLPFAFASKAATEPVADATKALADKSAAVVIVICDSPAYPALLVAPESRWALVNVGALGAGASADKLAERTEKETWRACCYLMGVLNSGSEHCLLRPVFSTADLDALTPKSLSPDAYIKIEAQAQKMGMKISRPTTYRKAVEEGWAPAPTNDFQRAIWQELHK